MSEPITLTERDLWIASAGNLLWGIARMAPGAPLPAEVVESARIVSRGYDQHVKPMCGDQPERRRANAESASPPRAPGASAPLGITGPVLPVESGPGQPMPPYTPDIAQGLDEWAAKYSEPEDVRARCLREAAAEIRRLLARADAAEARVKALEEAARLMIAAFDGYTNKPIDDGYWRALYDAKLALIAALKEPANG